jgi:hypothetical protein
VTILIEDMEKGRASVFDHTQQLGIWSSIRRYFYRILWTVRPPIDITDEYIRWLHNINAGILVPGNLYCFDYAIRNLPSQTPLLEIGSFCGLSTNIISYYKQKHGVSNALITCDKWQFEGAEQGGKLGESDITQDAYSQYARETYIRNTRMFSRDELPITVDMSSDEFFMAWRDRREVAHIHGGRVKLGGSLSFCYIDGDHTYAQVGKDFEHTDEFLEVGGYILFDDSADGWGWDGVRRVIGEVKKSPRYELVIRNPNYLFKKV